MLKDEYKKMEQIAKIAWKEQLKTQDNKQYADTINAILKKYDITEFIDFQDLIKIKAKDINLIGFND